MKKETCCTESSQKEYLSAQNIFEVKIKVSSRIFTAKMNKLIMHMDYFAAMAASGLYDKNSVVDFTLVNEIEERAMEIILNFVDTGMFFNYSSILI